MKTLKPQPSPKHRLYAKIRKPSVLRWIRPDADPSPEVWMLADQIQPDAKPEAPIKSIPPKETKPESTDSLKDIPEIPAKAEVKPKAAPKAKPGPKPKAKSTAAKKSETKTEDTK